MIQHLMNASHTYEFIIHAYIYIQNVHKLFFFKIREWIAPIKIFKKLYRKPAGNERNRGRGTPPISSTFQPVSWQFDNWWKPGYVDHVTTIKNTSFTPS